VLLIFKTIKRSLKSERHDFTTIPIAEAVILLAVPMILELSLEGVFAVVDMFFVSRLGASAIATVGLTESVITIIYSIAIGLSTGAAAIVARRVGEKNFDAAEQAAGQAILISLFLSVVLGTLSVIFARDILRTMGAAPEVVDHGAIFTQIMLGGCAPIILLFLINGIFRGAGDATMAMRSLWIASGANIVFCPIFIYFFGLKGAALATLCGRSLGVGFQCWHLFRGDGELKVLRRHFAWNWPVMKSIVTVAWPAAFQFIIGSGSWILLTRFVAESGGTPASAGYQIAVRCFVFFILPAMGLSNAAATLVGQNLGAKHYQRAEESAVVTAKYSAVLMLLFTLFLVGLAPQLVAVFTDDLVVREFGVQALRGISSGFLFYGVGMVMIQSLNGAGATRIPTLINIFCFWIFQIPMGYFLARHTSLGVHGVIYAIPMAHGLLAAMAWWVFRRGKWKSVQV